MSGGLSMCAKFVEGQGQVVMSLGQLRVSFHRRLEVFLGHVPVTQVVMLNPFRVVLGGTGISAWWRSERRTGSRTSPQQGRQAQDNNQGESVHGHSSLSRGLSRRPVLPTPQQRHDPRGGVLRGGWCHELNGRQWVKRKEQRLLKKRLRARIVVVVELR